MNVCQYILGVCQSRIMTYINIPETGGQPGLQLNLLMSDIHAYYILKSG